MLSLQEVKTLDGHARDIRRLALEMFNKIGTGHVGGAMSICDLLSVLYFKVMNIDPQNPKTENRDRFILSKGHAGPALYAALSLRGYFPREMCYTLNQPGTLLPSHCDMKRTPGVDMTAGSLAQGFSASTGVALACKLDKRDAYVYAVVGDGESQEGQVWEAAMFAGNRRLDNLIVFIDNNKMQIDGNTAEINGVEPIGDKWRAFKWNVISCDGHDVCAIYDAICSAKSFRGAPTAIIMDTVKGRGACFAEGLVASHSMPVTNDDLAAALEKLV